jgi:hypothetical protein
MTVNDDAARPESYHAKKTHDSQNDREVGRFMESESAFLKLIGEAADQTRYQNRQPAGPDDERDRY